MKTQPSKIYFTFRVLSFFLILFFIISCCNDNKDSGPTSIVGNVTTLAGSSVGYSDETGLAAQFNSPIGLCFDNHGDLIVGDWGNHKIRKVTLNGIVSTIAGSTEGYLDEVSSLAMFDFPSGVCRDASNNIFVCDQLNARIRKISPEGNVSTFAGSTNGYADGIGPSAMFSQQNAMCFDAAGNMYVADSGNDRIRKITTAGEVTTFAGGSPGFSDGIGIAAKFNFPKGICIDPTGNLYVSDEVNHRIRKITPSGEVSTIAGSTAGFNNGTGIEAQFRNPQNITIDPQGNLYVVDFYNQKIRKITTSGVVSTLAGSTQGYSDGKGEAAKFSDPRGIFYYKGKLYVADSGNHKIRVIQ